MNVYALECHFDSDELLVEFVRRNTYIDRDLIGNELIQYIKKSVADNFRMLWYISLEALKTACCFIYSIIDNIKKLQDACKNGEIKRCQFCEADSNHQSKNCQYRKRTNFMENDLKAFFYTTSIRNEEVEYIYQRIEQLGSTS